MAAVTSRAMLQRTEMDAVTSRAMLQIREILELQHMVVEELIYVFITQAKNYHHERTHIQDLAHLPGGYKGALDLAAFSFYNLHQFNKRLTFFGFIKVLIFILFVWFCRVVAGVVRHLVVPTYKRWRVTWWHQTNETGQCLEIVTHLSNPTIKLYKYAPCSWLL